VTLPIVRVKIGQAEQFLDPSPNALGETTMNEEVANSFGALLAKRAKAAIKPTAFLKMIRRPNPFLISEPREELNFGRRHTFKMHLFIGDAIEPRNCIS
jgi:hypothetical protein